jgi:energy-coupling factor transport system ATP-binding protein
MADRVAISSFSLQYSPSTPGVLSSVTLEIPEGTCCAVIGPTGAGKSSLLSCLAGTMRRHHPESISSGRIRIGETIYDGLPGQILFPAVGLVLQDPYVQLSGVCDTVYDEILFTLQSMGPLTTDPDQVIMSLMRDLGVDHLSHRKPTSLSGGETQRVALATILVARPSVLLLDEPVTALDPNARERLRRILKSLRGSATIILTDTQPDFALGVCDQIIVLDRGRAIFQGKPGQFFKRMQEFGSTLPLEPWNQLKPDLVTLLSDPSHHRSQIAKILGAR